ncbi:MAG: DUF3999 domain-containing protein [Pseudomonadota bacterium]
MMRLIPVLLAILLARPALAVDIGDFSQAIPLTVERSGGIYAVDLPEAVYRSLARTDFGDLRVFNGDDRIVPHSLRRSGVGSAASPDDWSAVPVYPLPSTAPAAATPDIRIDATAHRTRVDIGSAEPAVTAPVREWVVDTRSLSGPIDRLRLSWTTDDEDAGILRFRIDRSDDLSGWRQVPASGVIAALSHEGLRLVHRTLKLPADRYQYLRLQLTSRVSGGFAIDAVRVRRLSNPAAPHRYRQTAVGRFVTGKSPGYLFTFTGVRPADRAILALSSDGQILQGALSSRPGPATDWHRRYAGIFYRIRSGDDTIDSGAADLSMVTDRYWKLDISSKDPHAGAAPTLTLEWIPHELVFAAEGRPPYRLAYGSDRVTPPDNEAMGALMARLGANETDRLIGRASVGQPVPMAGEAAYQRFHLPAAWRRWGLWAVLCAGALMLIVLAWRQFKRMG